MYATNSESAKSASEGQLGLPHLPGVILVVEDDDLPKNSRLQPGSVSGRGFVLGGGEANARGTQVNTKDTPSGLQQRALPLLSAILPVLPGSIAIDAIAYGVAGAAGIYAGMKADSAEAKQALQEAEDKAKAFLVNHAVTPNGAKELGFRFAPGHPRPNVAYRLHPLADIPGSGQTARYIPRDSFDQTLLEERESELLRLLVELGATRIVIAERRTSKDATSMEAELKADASVAGDAKVSGSRTDTQHGVESNTREFHLVGKPTQAKDRVQEDDFAWLPFEPSWRSLAQARQIGQCTRATLELTEETYYSNESKLEAALRMAGRGGGAAGKLSTLSESNVTYTYNVDFAPFSKSDA